MASGSGPSAVEPVSLGPAAEMRHHMMMRLFPGNLLPIEETSRLLIGYRDRMAARAESYDRPRSGSPAR